MTHNAWVLQTLPAVLASALTTSALLLAGAGSTEAAPSSQLLSAGDPRGDVVVGEAPSDATPAVLDSVDLRHVAVIRRPHGVRIVLHIDKVLPRGRWIQELGVTMQAPGWIGPSGFFLVTAAPQYPKSGVAFTADVTSEGDHESEDDPGCRVALSKTSTVVRLDVPKRCLPDFPGRLTVDTILLDKRSKSAVPVAQDELKVHGRVDLTP